MKVRAANLTDARVRTIISVIDGWDGKLTWEGLIQAVRGRVGQTYTRQALSRKASIAEAFRLQKKRVLERPVLNGASSPILGVALARTARLERRLERAEAQNAALMEQFVRWAYNARTHGLTLEILNEPLPKVDRRQTVTKPNMRSSANDPAG